jgi:hypothetical protein
MRKLKSSIVKIIILLLPLMGYTGSYAQSVWSQNSFKDFKEETFQDAGSNCYISAKSRIQSCDGVIAYFNKDGKNDLAVVNYRDSHVHRVPAWIYYGTESGFSPYCRTELPAVEGNAIVAGDFNRDSWIDLAIACRYWKESDDPYVEPRKSFIYWNSPKGFNPENRTVLIFISGKYIQYRRKIDNSEWRSYPIFN